MPYNIDSLTSYYLDSDVSYVLLETLQFSHSAWSEDLFYVSNHDDGFAALDESNNPVVFNYLPMMIVKGVDTDTLDQTLDITFGDLGTVLPDLIKQIRAADSLEKPKVVYRLYAYDSNRLRLLNTKPLEVIKGLEIDSVTRNSTSTTVKAATPTKNQVKTGLQYSFDEFPDLLGFL